MSRVRAGRGRGEHVFAARNVSFRSFVCSPRGVAKSLDIFSLGVRFDSVSF